MENDKHTPLPIIENSRSTLTKLSFYTLFNWDLKQALQECLRELKK